MNTTTSPATPRDVLDFWLGDGLTHGWPTQDLGKRWFGGGAALDEEIKNRFGARVMQALDGELSGELNDWADTSSTPATSPLGRLALIIILDQFTRNVFRGKGTPLPAMRWPSSWCCKPWQIMPTCNCRGWAACSCTCR